MNKKINFVVLLFVLMTITTTVSAKNADDIKAYMNGQYANINAMPVNTPINQSAPCNTQWYSFAGLWADWRGGVVPGTSSCYIIMIYPDNKIAVSGNYIPDDIYNLSMSQLTPYLTSSPLATPTPGLPPGVISITLDDYRAVNNVMVYVNNVFYNTYLPPSSQVTLPIKFTTGVIPLNSEYRIVITVNPAYLVSYIEGVGSIAYSANAIITGKINPGVDAAYRVHFTSAPTPTPLPNNFVCRYGDVNMDGVITASDAGDILGIANGNIYYQNIQKVLSDLNGDNKVTNLDYEYLRNYVVHVPPYGRAGEIRPCTLSSTDTIPISEMSILPTIGVVTITYNQLLMLLLVGVILIALYVISNKKK